MRITKVYTRTEEAGRTRLIGTPARSVFAGVKFTY